MKSIRLFIILAIAVLLLSCPFIAMQFTNEFNFKNIWFSEKAYAFRKTVGKVKECEGCYHHCFISPAVFRTPAMWPRIAKSIIALNG